MKKQLLLFLSILLTLFFTGCENLGPDPAEDSILPETFGIDIPDAISYEDSQLKSALAVDPLNGNRIYHHLGTFIRAGEAGADIVGHMIRVISHYHINRPMSLSIESEDDGRVKNIVVTESPFFEGTTWEFGLTMTDADSESEPDGGKALQIFWNRRPIEGVAILKPYNLDRTRNTRNADAMFRIDYSETGDRGYDRHMIVAVSGLTVIDALENPYSMGTLKMFVGKKGDIVDVYGNSDHPNAKFFNSDSGFNWAFVASGNDLKNIGVAEVGLPPSYLDEPSREVLLKDYSIKNVFTDQIYEVWPNINSSSVEIYLTNTSAPGFFNNGGFIQGGTSPGVEFDPLVEKLGFLSPYNPFEITNMMIGFN